MKNSQREMSRRNDATRESKNIRIAILGLTKYRMTGSFRRSIPSFTIIGI